MVRGVGRDERILKVVDSRGVLARSAGCWHATLAKYSTRRRLGAHRLLPATSAKLAAASSSEWLGPITNPDARRTALLLPCDSTARRRPRRSHGGLLLPPACVRASEHKRPRAPGAAKPPGCRTSLFREGLVDRDVVGVAMRDLPLAVFTTEDVRDTQRVRLDRDADD